MYQMSKLIRFTLMTAICVFLLLTHGIAEEYTTYADYQGISIVQKNRFQGALSSDGSIVINCDCDAVMIPEFGVIRYVKENKWGLSDFKGNDLLQCKYDYISPFDRNHSLYNPWLSYYQMNDLIGIISSNGEILTGADFDASTNPLEYLYNNGLALKKNGLWGVLSPVDGSILIQFDYPSFDTIPFDFAFIPYGSEYYIMPQTNLSLTDGISVYDITATELDICPYEKWLNTISSVYKNTEWVVTTPAMDQIGFITNPENISDTKNCVDRGISRHYYKKDNVIVYLNIYGEIVQCLSNSEVEYAWEAFGMVEW